MNKRNTKHNMSDTPTHNIWKDMRQRCNNENNQDYEYYGGRGIKVCDRWNKFENFLSDMGERPDGCSIDRVDNDGNYCPENCRYATLIEQNNNKRSNRKIIYAGKEYQSLAGFCREFDLPYMVVLMRLKDGWTIEESLETPIRKWEKLTA